MTTLFLHGGRDCTMQPHLKEVTVDDIERNDNGDGSGRAGVGARAEVLGGRGRSRATIF